MAEFKIYHTENAPVGSREILETAGKKYGFVPNLLGVLAESPAALEAYTAVGAAFEKSSLSPVEQQVVLLSTSFENGCTYCMAAHSTVAIKVGAGNEVLKALREGSRLPDDRLEALRLFTRSVVEHRGLVSQDDLESFLRAGFDKAQVLEVITGVAQKTLSNYTNHVAHTPVDAVFQAQAWVPHEDKAAVSASPDSRAAGGQMRHRLR